MTYETELNANRKNWNDRVHIHKRDTKYYNIKAFKQGELSFKANEHHDLKNFVGDFKSKTLLHLQCHFGLDTMSFSRLGIVATGVDFSEDAIQLAQSLCDELQLDTRFICSDVYKLPEILDQKFDIIFTSIGVIGWLPDLDKWAKVIANHLKLGGIFYLKDSHPITNIFTVVNDQLQLKYDYFRKESSMYDDGRTYAGDQSVKNNPTNYQWHHSLDVIMDSLTTAGLSITVFKEYSHTFFERYSKLSMVQNERGYWELPRDLHKTLPLSFMLVATNKHNRN